MTTRCTTSATRPPALRSVLIASAVLALVASLLAAPVTAAAPPATAMLPCGDPPTAFGDRCPEWVSVYERAAQGESGPVSNRHATSVAISPDGSRAFVSGNVNDDSLADDMANWDAVIAAYDTATGEELWVARYDDGGSRSQFTGADVTTSPDGSLVYLTGNAELPPLNDWLVVAYDAATGSLVWEARYDGPASYSDQVSAITADPDGDLVYVTGMSSNAAGEWYLATVAFHAATGQRRWVDRYAKEPCDWTTSYGYDVVADASGERLYVTGVAKDCTRGDGEVALGVATIAFHADTGERLWTAAEHPDEVRYGGVGDGGIALDVAPDGGRVFVTGSSLRGGDDATVTSSPFEYITVAYDADTGDRAWLQRYAGSQTLGTAPQTTGNSKPAGLAVSPDGQTVVVTGSSQEWRPSTAHVYVAPAKRMATVAYDATTGAELWEAQEDPVLDNVPGPEGLGPVHSIGTAVAFSRDGRHVHVAGKSRRGTSFLTVHTYDAPSGHREWTGHVTAGPPSALAPLLGGAADLVVDTASDRLVLAGSSGSALVTAMYSTACAQVRPTDIPAMEATCPTQ